MCGRSSLFADQSDLEARFDAEVVADGGYTPRYNIAPGDGLEVITNEADAEINQYHWGLIPFWTDEPGDGLVNARSETAGEKRVFEKAWESRPCLVLSSGFYEWFAAGPDAREELCRPYPEDDLTACEISTRVNDPGNDDPSVIEPLEHEQSGLGEYGSG